MWPAKSVYAARGELKIKKLSKLLKSWNFCAGNGQKLALKANRMKKKHYI